MAIERIKLNLIPAGTMPVCHAKQYDKKRQIGIDIYNGLQPYILSDELLELDVRKPDGHIVTIDVPYTAGRNGVVFETTEQMCAITGSNLCALKITKGEAEIGSINFFMEVEKSPLEGGLPSDSEIENLRTQMQAIAQPMLDDLVPPMVETLVPEVVGDDYYNKNEIDDIVSGINGDLEGIEHDIDNLETDLESKADANEVAEKLEEKADKETTYTQEQVNNIVSDAIYGILPSELTPTGAVANFSTTLEMPLKSLEVDVNAVQESGTPTPASPLPISGWSKISLTKCGANLWDEETENGYLSSSDGSFISNANSICSKNFRLINPSAQVYVATSTDKTMYICWYDENKTFISRAVCGNTSVTSPFNARYFKLSCYNYGSTYNNDTSVNCSSNDTTYHAYNATTEVINLGGTYYGGHFTQDKDGHRQFEVTCAKEHISLQGKTPTTTSGYDSWAVNLSNRSLPASNTTNKKCSVCGTYKYEGSSANIEHFYITATVVVIYLNENTFRNGEFDILYPLETPYVIDLPDGEPIITLNGTNNVYADTGDCAVEYKVSIEQYVSNHSGGGLGGGLLGGGFLGSNPNPNESEGGE